MKGKFITLEGCEGVGKSTQLKMLKEYLEKTGQEAVFTREPGGTPVAEAIRKVLLDETLSLSAEVEALLFVAARVSHIDDLILPALNEGKIVVSDRYVDSSFAYQGFARGLGLEYVMELNHYAIERCMPDCTIFIDMDPEFSWRKQKGTVVLGDRMEKEELSFHKACYVGFDKITDKFKERIVRLVPGTEKEITHEKLIGELRRRKIIK